MKSVIQRVVIGMAGLLFLFSSFGVEAKTKDTISQGIFIENMDVSGLTKEQAKQMVADYVETLKPMEIELKLSDDQKVTVTAGDLGIVWENQDIIEDAVSLGKTGNLISRYKEKADLTQQNKVYELEFSCDDAAINLLITEKCEPFNVPAKNATLKKEGGGFTVEEGQTGITIDVAASAKAVCAFLTDSWDYQTGVVELVTKTEQPKGTAEELAKVKDVLGSATTVYHSSGRDRSANVSNGCRLINGTTLYPGDVFSTYEVVSPFTQEHGYYMAGSYVNGMVVDSLGGGICQVSTTLYNAVLNAELEIVERSNHSMIVGYVPPSADAAIAGTYKDFKFKNNTDTPIYIEGIASESKDLTFKIYGLETRPSNRVVTYESEVLEKNVPAEEKIVADEGRPVGSIDVQSAHIGYKARLWKVVTVDGVEVERTQINKSTYKATPRTATVGVAHGDPNVKNAVLAAIASGSIDHVRNTISFLTTPVAPEVPVDPQSVAP